MSVDASETDTAEVLTALGRSSERATASAQAERERAEALEKRVKVLQAQNAKLSRLLQGEQEEAALRSAVAGPRDTSRTDGAASGENRPPPSGAEEGAETARKREQALARWEEGVKLRKRAESLAKKLAERTKELEDQSKLAAKRADLVADLTKEKTTLQAKVRQLSEEVKRAGEAALAGAPDANAARELHDENEALHRELASLQRTVDVEQAAEIARLKRQLEGGGASSGGGSKAAGSTGGRGGTGVGGETTTAAALEGKVRALEGELLQRDDVALGLRFEAEQSNARAERLQRRIDRLFKGAPDPVKGSDVASPRQPPRRVQELEDVVEALKKVVERQQSELAAVRGQAAAGARGTEHARAAKELRLKLRDLEAEMVGLRRTATAHKELLQRSQKMEAQVAALRAQVREAKQASDEPGGQAGGDAQGRALAAARADASAAAAALAETREALVAAETAREAAEARAVEAGRSSEAAHARHAAAQRVAAAEEEAQRLRGENADLRAELDALDPAFFDEVMDMKRAYHEQTAVLEEYEGLLRRYAAQLNVPFAPRGGAR